MEPALLGWQKAYVEWRVSHEAELDAVAGVVAERVHDEHIWRLINELVESALLAGWASASGERPHTRGSA